MLRKSLRSNSAIMLLTHATNSKISFYSFYSFILFILFYKNQSNFNIKYQFVINEFEFAMNENELTNI